MRSLRFGQSCCAFVGTPKYSINWDKTRKRHETGMSSRPAPEDKSGVEAKPDMAFAVMISRVGYTGEDGFEIFINRRSTSTRPRLIVEQLLAAGGGNIVRLAGLGARDTLRLEAGLCLSGQDFDETKTPVEAGLSWIIPKSRRGADAGFLGAERIAKQLSREEPVGSRRVGLMMTAKHGPPARQGAIVRGGAGADARPAHCHGVLAPRVARAGDQGGGACAWERARGDRDEDALRADQVLQRAVRRAQRWWSFPPTSQSFNPREWEGLAYECALHEHAEQGWWTIEGVIPVNIGFFSRFKRPKKDRIYNQLK